MRPRTVAEARIIARRTGPSLHRAGRAFDKALPDGSVLHVPLPEEVDDDHGVVTFRDKVLSSVAKALGVSFTDMSIEWRKLEMPWVDPRCDAVPPQCDDCLPDGTCTMNCSCRRPDQRQYLS